MMARRFIELRFGVDAEGHNLRIPMISASDSRLKSATCSD
jgi:hypothetical protein